MENRAIGRRRSSGGAKWIVGILLLGFLLLGGCARKALLPGVNIILITTDTLRADHLGCYGYPWARTPSIDRLAKEGVLFARMLASVPLTLPSHTSFITGLYPGAHGVHDNGAYVLGEEKTTLAEYLRDHGYRTAAAVSSFQLNGKYGIDQGFAEYDDGIPKEFLIHDVRIAEGPKADNIRYQSEQRRADQITAWAREWLEKGGVEPFFLWLHYFDPHETYDPPPPYDSMFPSLPFPHNKYDGEIAFLDEEIGALLQLLEERGLYDRTLVVFSADHGEGLGEHQEMYHDTFIYDSTLRIPLILSGGALPDEWAASVVAEPARSVDVLPTLLEMIGVDPDKEVQGRSLIPAMAGKASEGEWWNYCETHSPTHNLCAPLYGIYSREWKYVEAPKPELYHLAVDPGETRNLIHSHPEKANELSRRLAALLPEAVSEPRELDEETREKLEAIGYVHERPPSGGGGANEPVDPKDQLPCIDGLHKAVLYFTYGELDSSLAVLQELVETCPGQVRVYDNIGNLQIRLELYDDLIRQFTPVTAIYPHYAKGCFWIGMAYMRKDRLEESLTWFRRAVDRDPGDHSSRYNIGLVLGKMGEPEEALAVWEEVMRRDPNGKVGRLAKKAHSGVKAAIEKATSMQDSVLVEEY